MVPVSRIIGAYPPDTQMSSGFVGLSARLEGKYHVYYCNVAAAGSRRILILFFSVLYKRRFTVHELALTGVMAALSLVAYLFFRIPFYGGSSFHLGNTFTALTALLLDGVSGGLAGAIGLALADILAGDPGYAITTFVLKFIIGITCGAVAHKVFKLRDQDRHSAGYLVKVIVSAGSVCC